MRRLVNDLISAKCAVARSVTMRMSVPVKTVLFVSTILWCSWTRRLLVMMC